MEQYTFLVFCASLLLQVNLSASDDDHTSTSNLFIKDRDGSNTEQESPTTFKDFDDYMEDSDFLHKHFLSEYPAERKGPLSHPGVNPQLLPYSQSSFFLGHLKDKHPFFNPYQPSGAPDHVRQAAYSNTRRIPLTVNPQQFYNPHLNHRNPFYTSSDDVEDSFSSGSHLYSAPPYNTVLGSNAHRFSDRSPQVPHPGYIHPSPGFIRILNSDQARRDSILASGSLKFRPTHFQNNIGDYVTDLYQSKLHPGRGLSQNYDSEWQKVDKQPFDLAALLALLKNQQQLKGLQNPKPESIAPHPWLDYSPPPKQSSENQFPGGFSDNYFSGHNNRDFYSETPLEGTLSEVHREQAVFGAPPKFKHQTLTHGTADKTPSPTLPSHVLLQQLHSSLLLQALAEQLAQGRLLEGPTGTNTTYPQLPGHTIQPTPTPQAAGAPPQYLILANLLKNQSALAHPIKPVEGATAALLKVPQTLSSKPPYVAFAGSVAKPDDLRTKSKGDPGPQTGLSVSRQPDGLTTLSNGGIVVTTSSPPDVPVNQPVWTATVSSIQSSLNAPSPFNLTENALRVLNLQRQIDEASKRAGNDLDNNYYSASGDIRGPATPLFDNSVPHWSRNFQHGPGFRPDTAPKPLLTPQQVQILHHLYSRLRGSPPLPPTYSFPPQPLQFPGDHFDADAVNHSVILGLQNGPSGTINPAENYPSGHYSGFGGYVVPGDRNREGGDPFHEKPVWEGTNHLYRPSTLDPSSPSISDTGRAFRLNNHPQYQQRNAFGARGLHEPYLGVAGRAFSGGDGVLTGTKIEDIASIITHTKSPKCDEEFSKLEDFCIHVSSSPHSWKEGEQYCKSKGSWLYFSKNRQQDEALGRFLKEKGQTKGWSAYSHDEKNGGILISLDKLSPMIPGEHYLTPFPEIVTAKPGYCLAPQLEENFYYSPESCISKLPAVCRKEAENGVKTDVNVSHQQPSNSSGVSPPVSQTSAP